MTRNGPERFESGWENPDHHPGLAQRARPMFDAQGKAVDSVPEPEPLTPAERAMFAAMEISVPEAQAMAMAVFNGGERALAGHGAAQEGKLATVRELAAKAMDNPSPAAWAVALAEILRELDS